MGQTRFFAIGVEQAEGGERLTSVDACIEAIARYVREWWPRSVIAPASVNARRSWTCDAVLDVLHEQLGAAETDDVVVVYWMGEAQFGGSHQLLLTNHHILARDLVEPLLDCRARHVLVFLDCCWSGAGAFDMMEEAEQVRERRGPDEDDVERSVTVVATARPGERAVEGVFVEALTALLAGGPPSSMPATHAWSATDSAITPEALVAALNRRFGDEGRVHHRARRYDLREGTAGALVPLMRDAATGADAEVDELSAARRGATLLFDGMGVGRPARWTASGLRAHRDAIGLATTDDVARGVLVSMCDALVLALEAEQLVMRLLSSSTQLRAGDLYTARLAVLGSLPRSAERRRFDYFFDVVRPRASKSARQPVRDMLKFVSTFLHLAGFTVAPVALFGWARRLGFEDQMVNDRWSDAQREGPERRLVIDLRRVAPVYGEAVATAQIFRNGTSLGAPLEEPVASPTLDATLDVIGRLVDRIRQNDQGQIRRSDTVYDRIDVVAPDSLIFLEPDKARIRSQGRTRTLGDDGQPVGLRSAAKLDYGADWRTLSDGYSDIMELSRRVCVPVERFDDEDDWADSGCAAVFGALPRVDREPVPAMMSALYGSPVVLWTTAAVDDEFEQLMEANWEDLSRFVSSMQPSSVDPRLHHLRGIWEDESWLEFAEKTSTYDNGG